MPNSVLALSLPRSQIPLPNSDGETRTPPDPGRSVFSNTGPKPRPLLRLPVASLMLLLVLLREPFSRLFVGWHFFPVFPLHSPRLPPTSQRGPPLLSPLLPCPPGSPRLSVPSCLGVFLFPWSPVSEPRGPTPLPSWNGL